ncbi:hypothetical protein AMS68_003144 [Peltaster fructicola]|uniref:Uncharacterized protein n=1 Tax=Peltaster fructicola TaxID=286661 RepID=A0A6H0XS87_9PEZI|nr:hypothetical protein AMS68_003144 [Peltaster fructicola]
MSRQERRYSARAEVNGEPSGWQRHSNGAPIHEEHGYSGPPDRPQFFVPSYLSRSRHAQRLKHEWEERVKTEVQDTSAFVPSTPDHSATTSLLINRSTSPLPHVHRGVSQRVIERPSAHYTQSTRPRGLPTKWNRGDGANGVEVLGDGSEVRFSGAQFKTQDEAASIRSDVPVPKEVGLYYYEVTIMSRSKDALIGVGFATDKSMLTRLPGWEPDAFAYHGDDGEVFSGQSSGRSYGPHLVTHDVVGCGINFRTNSIFFTRNGNYLGSAFSDVKPGEYFPIIGFRKNGDHARANFGRQLFVFDIDAMMDQERQITLGSVARQTTEKLHPPDDESALIENLISQYLAHEGYIATSRAFQLDLQDRKRQAPSTSDQDLIQDNTDDVHATQRQRIRGAMLDGDLDRALKYTQMYYPQVLQDQRNKGIYFRLRCRKLIEMMRRWSELSAAIRMNGNDAADSKHVDTQMELDDQLHREVSKENESAHGDIEMDISSDTQNAATKESELFDAAISYGQGLREEFESNAQSGFKQELDTVFSLFAYNDARTSDEVRHLVDKSGRSTLAEELNGAILGMLHVLIHQIMLTPS